MNIVAFERAKQGTGASRRLRNSGRAPGIIYGGATEAQTIELDHNTLWHALKKEAFHSSVLEMDVAGTVSKVVLRDVQYHPYKQQVLHIDFQRVDDKTKLHLKVPLHFVGAEESPAVKADKCTVNHVMNEINVSCMPSDLPEFITVDLSGIKKGTSLHLQDVALPKGATLVTHGSDKNPVVVAVVAPVVVVEVAAVEAAPAKGKGKKK
ncbi:MAG: 50S ribosomal protein L25/general stress protein Ctc [Burkholderiaceae bacterium]|nr:50S ribosomal protein L25/general stress protein Ctc [Burkholderiaceae bacterium]